MLPVFQYLLAFGGILLAVTCLAMAGWYAERYWERRFRENNENGYVLV